MSISKEETLRAAILHSMEIKRNEAIDELKRLILLPRPNVQEELKEEEWFSKLILLVTDRDVLSTLLPLFESVSKRDLNYEGYQLRRAIRMLKYIREIGHLNTHSFITPIIGILIRIIQCYSLEDPELQEQLDIIRDTSVEIIHFLVNKFNTRLISGYITNNVIDVLLGNWDFNPRIIAAAKLYSLFYDKLSRNDQIKARFHLTVMCRKNSPTVQVCAIQALIEIMGKCQTESEVVNYFYPIYLYFRRHPLGRMREMALSLGLTMSTCVLHKPQMLNDLSTFRAEDKDNLTRLSLAIEVQNLLNAGMTVDVLSRIFRTLLLDSDDCVRIRIIDNLFDFIKYTYENYPHKKTIITTMIMLLSMSFKSKNDLLRNSVATAIFSIYSLVKETYMQNYLPPIVNEKFIGNSNIIRFTFLKCLDEILDIYKLDTVPQCIFNAINTLMDKKDEQYSTDFNVRVKIIWIINRIVQQVTTTKKMFNDNLTHIYIRLLNDKNSTVKNLTPIIFPNLVKRFGHIWVIANLIAQICAQELKTSNAEFYISPFLNCLVNMLLLDCDRNYKTIYKFNNINEIRTTDKNIVDQLAKLHEYQKSIDSKIKTLFPNVVIQKNDFNINLHIRNEKDMEIYKKQKIADMQITLSETDDDEFEYLEEVVKFLNDYVLDDLHQMTKFVCSPICINELEEVVGIIGYFNNNLGNRIRNERVRQTNYTINEFVLGQYENPESPVASTSGINYSYDDKRSNYIEEFNINTSSSSKTTARFVTYPVKSPNLYKDRIPCRRDDDDLRRDLHNPYLIKYYRMNESFTAEEDNDENKIISEELKDVNFGTYNLRRDLQSVIRINYNQLLFPEPPPIIDASIYSRFKTRVVPFYKKSPPVKPKPVIPKTVLRRDGVFLVPEVPRRKRPATVRSDVLRRKMLKLDEPSTSAT